MTRLGRLSLLLLAAIAGCGKPAVEAQREGAYRIAVIPKGSTHEFWRGVRAGAEKAAQELGTVKLLWKGPVQENDREGQINVIQDFITQRVSGILLSPVDSQALVASVRDAQAEGIPTLVFDSGLDESADIVSFVATDNYHGGELAATRLAQAIGGKGKVALLRHRQGSQSTGQRERGFLETLAKQFPDVRVVESAVYAGTTPAEARANAEQLLVKYGKDLDGVFTVSEPNNDGMLEALDDANLAGKVKFVGFDPSPAMIRGMQDGKVHGIVLQDPLRIGYLAVRTMAAHLAGQTVEKRVATGEFLATPENLQTPEIARLLHPARF